jgi:hypothetical protein
MFEEIAKDTFLKFHVANKPLTGKVSESRGVVRND